MSPTVFTNRVVLNINAQAVDARFDIWSVQTDLKGKANYGRIINTIYRELKPLSVAREKPGQYSVLFPKGRDVLLDDRHFSLRKKKSAADMADITCARLLIHAMPNLSDKEHFCEGVGLYYLQDIKPIRSVEVIRTHKVELETRNGRTLLQIRGSTFTPVSYHTNADGELYKDCRHLPRITFDRWSERLTRSTNGEFINKKHRDKRMSSEMVSLDTKNPGKFWVSKMGTLAHFYNDIQTHFADLLSIDLEPLSASYRMRYKEKRVEDLYQRIDQILMTQSINLINLTEVSTTPLESALTADNIPWRVSTKIDAKALNWVIHHNVEYYEERKLPDPYQELHCENAVVQSAHPETLFKKDGLSTPQYEACKKELLIKLEVHQNQLVLVVPEGEWTFICMNVSEVNQEEANNAQQPDTYHVLNIRDGEMSYRLAEINDIEDTLLDLPRLPGKNDCVVVDDLGGDGFIIQETGMVAVPEYQKLAQIMSELEQGYDRGVKYKWIIEFLDLVRLDKLEIGNKKQTEQLRERLEKILAVSRGRETIPNDILLKNKETALQYKGTNQKFFDWVALEKGLRLGVSLKGENAGFVEASLGLFYSEDDRLYFVGDKDNIKNIPRFSVIRRIETDADEVPEALLRMMEVFHVRHRQATVYPFPFKHLAEYSRSQMGSGQPPVSLPEPLQLSFLN